MARSAETRWPDAAIALAVLAFGLLLCLLGAGLLAQWQDAAGRHQDTSVDSLLASAAAAGGMVLLLWWVLSALAAGASVLLERLGRRRAAAAARRLSPAFMQRAVVAALSIQLLTGAAANAATNTPGPEWTPTQVHLSSTPSDPSVSGSVEQLTGSGVLSRTDRPSPPGATEKPPGKAGPAADWKTDAQPAPATLNPGWQPARPLVDPGLLAPSGARASNGPAAGTQARAVTVIAGDTLWDIVATYLGPDASDVDIALEWPRWYAANRGLIGGSPDVLLPGQILQAPAAR